MGNFNFKLKLMVQEDKKMDKVKLSKDILTMVGGEENVDQVVHCMTRLRFNLHDDNIPNKKEIEKLDGVMGVMINGGQYQVIIGNEVAGVHAELMKHMSPGSDSKQTSSGASASSKKSKNPISQIFDFIAGIFTPILPAITGAGMVKGIVAILVSLGWMSDKGPTYEILAAIGDGAFYFLPILLAVSAARKLGSNMYTAAALGATILHPKITDLLATGDTNFVGIKVIAATYSSTVIPILIAIWLASYVEKYVDKVTPAALKLLVVPTITLLVMVPVTLTAVGPIGAVAGNGLSDGISWLFGNAGLFAGLLIGGTMSLLIITGMHYALIPIIISSIATLGFDYIIPIMGAANLAQAGASFGVYLKSKNKKMKTTALSTATTAIMGITEPAMYGVNMKLKKPFIAALLGGAIGGAFLSFFGTKAYVMAGLVGLAGIPMFIGPTLVYALIGLVISFVAAAILTYIIGFEEENEEMPKSEASTTDIADLDSAMELVSDNHLQSETIYSPITGEVKPLSAVPDPAFSEEIMGKGVAIEPSEGRVVAPVNGTVFSVSKSGHAIGIVSDKGAEMLIHIGIDTVKLKGQHFTPHVKAGAQVVVGDLLMEFDHIAIKQAGYEIITPVIITNIDQYNALENNEITAVKQGERLYSLKV